jgi:hypothetical protein
MKALCAALVFCVAAQVHAQDDAAVRLDDLRLDAPPATFLVGVSPAAVQRPNTPRALIASLISATGSSGVVPNGFAMETSPYWLAAHPMLQLSEYFHPSVADRLKYFTAVSVATARPKARSDSINPDAHVSIALRTLLANGHPSPALVKVSEEMRKAQQDYLTEFVFAEQLKGKVGDVDALRTRLAREDALLSTLVTRTLVGPDPGLRDSTLRTLSRRDSARSALERAESQAAQLERREKRMDALEEKLSKLAVDFAHEDLEPDGFILELAAGTRARFIEGQWGHQRVDGIGVWITPMYRMSQKKLEMLGVARYLTRVADYADRNVFDIGGRLTRDIGKGSIGAEFTHRELSQKGKATSRWAAIFSVPIPANLQILGSFGSDFRNQNGKRPVIATLGINLGVGAITLAPNSRKQSL